MEFLEVRRQLRRQPTTGTLGSGPVTGQRQSEFQPQQRGFILPVANAISGTGTVSQIGTGTHLEQGQHPTGGDHVGGASCSSKHRRFGRCRVPVLPRSLVNAGTATPGLNGLRVGTRPAQLNLNGTGLGGNGAPTGAAPAQSPLPPPVQSAPSSSSIGGAAKDITLTSTVGGASATGLFVMARTTSLLSGSTTPPSSHHHRGRTLLLVRARTPPWARRRPAATGTETVKARGASRLGLASPLAIEALTINGVEVQPRD